MILEAFKLYKIGMIFMLYFAFTFTEGEKSIAGFLSPDDVYSQAGFLSPNDMCSQVCASAFFFLIFRKHSKNSD